MMEPFELAGQRKRIVILGGGFAGAYALKAAKKTLPLDCEVVLIDRNNYLLFYPLLVEAGVGSIEARHVVVPIRKFLNGQIFIMAQVTSVNLETGQVSFQIEGRNDVSKLAFDHLVIGLGSVTKIPDVPGLTEHGFQVKSLDDAIGLRDRGIRLLELANTVRDSDRRRELLTFVTVGANYTGVEFAGEFHAFMHEAAKAYPNVRSSEIRMILIEYSQAILSGTSEKLRKWCENTLRQRGIEIQLGTTLTEIGQHHTLTTGGQMIQTHTVVWAAGIEANPLVKQIVGLPLNNHGYIDCDRDLSVKGLENIWAIGDVASVLDDEGKPFSATAQTASRQGPLVVRNIAARMKSETAKPFGYTNLGAFAAIGRKQAAANVLGIQITGFWGWVMYRGTYLMKMPSLSMKIRLLADWTTEIVFKNEPVQLGLRRQRSQIGEAQAPVMPQSEPFTLL